MASMDTGDGPSRSGRGGGQWQNNRGGGYNNHNNYNNYNNNRGRGSNRGYSSPGNRGSYNNGYSASGYNTSGYSNQGYGPGAGGRQAWGGRGRGRGRGRAAGRGPLHFPDPEDIKFLKVMKGHTKKVTSIALNPDAQQIYTGSADRTLRVWHMETGQCIQTIDAGGEVDSMLLSGKMLIVGLHVSNEEGMVRAWHIDLGTDLVLPGRHRGAVLCLAQAAQLLFSGGQDTTIKVWSFDAASQAFQPLVELSQARGGHDSSVQCITVDQQYLYSADWHGCIKVWGMQQGQCLQTIPSAHGPSATPNYAGLVMGLLPYQLASCAGLPAQLCFRWQRQGVGPLRDPPAQCCPGVHPKLQSSILVGCWPEGRVWRSPSHVWHLRLKTVSGRPDITLAGKHNTHAWLAGL
ncbi:hypothetical protein ABBQ32_009100 [Trebouxia sp. C0010 RCD-2024]